MSPVCLCNTIVFGVTADTIYYDKSTRVNGKLIGMGSLVHPANLRNYGNLPLQEFSLCILKCR